MENAEKTNLEVAELKPNSSTSPASPISTSDMVSDVIRETAKDTRDVKEMINLAATQKALENETTVKKIVEEKTDELLNDAEAKKVKAITDRVREEVLKVKQEEEQAIAELRKNKSILEGEIEELKRQTDKAQAFFDANKSILKCIGVKQRLSLRAMQWLMIPAGIVFTLFSILLLPFSLLGFGIEGFIDIIESICGKFAKGGWKIVGTIVVSLIIGALLVGIYYVCTRWVVTLF